MTKRKILIPVDGSDFSRQIIQAVYNLFKPQDAEIVLLRVALPLVKPIAFEPVRPLMAGLPPYEIYPSTSEEGYTWSAQEQEAHRLELLDMLKAEAMPLQKAGYTVSTQVAWGDPADRITQFVQDANIDLVAMTTHGRTGIGRLVLGSVAENVLRHVHVPVILWHTGAQPVTTGQPETTGARPKAGRPMQIAVATDGSAFGQQAVNVGKTLAKQLHADFKLLITVSDQETVEHNQQVMGETVKLVADVQPKPPIAPLVGHTDEVLLEYLDKYPADLLVLGAFHDRGAGSPRAIGMTAHRVVQYAPVSVLMLKGQERPLRKLLACVDVDDPAVVDITIRIAQAIGATVDLLHVVPPAVAPYLSASPKQEMQLTEVMAMDTHLAAVMKTWVEQLQRIQGGQEHLHLRRGPVVESILEMAHEGNYDMTIVGSQSTPGHFLHTVANRVLSFAEQPVLIVRANPLWNEK